MFKKLLASFGVGSAKVDTHLEHVSFFPGEEVRGITYVVGGDLAQNIDDIYINLVTCYLKEINDSTHRINHILTSNKITSAFSIQPNETRSFPFSLWLPYDTPLTLSNHPVYFQTGLDIKNAIDPSDKDFIEVKPLPLMQAVFNGMQALGFYFKRAECEYSRRLARNYPFVQECEFKANYGSSYSGKVDEVEVIFLVNTPEQIDVILEIDRRAKGLKGLFTEAFDMDERKVHIQASGQDLNQPPGYWAKTLSDAINMGLR